MGILTGPHRCRQACSLPPTPDQAGQPLVHASSHSEAEAAALQPCSLLRALSRRAGSWGKHLMKSECSQGPGTQRATTSKCSQVQVQPGSRHPAYQCPACNHVQVQPGYRCPACNHVQVQPGSRRPVCNHVQVQPGYWCPACNQVQVLPGPSARCRKAAGEFGRLTLDSTYLPQGIV